MRVYIAIAVAFQGCIIPCVCVRGCACVGVVKSKREGKGASIATVTQNGLLKCKLL